MVIPPPIVFAIPDGTGQFEQLRLLLFRRKPRAKSTACDDSIKSGII
jgi:hypothetical protein